MASFLQPAVFDPDAYTIDPEPVTTTGRFLVYTNSSLVGSGELATWYQYLVLGLATAALVIPLLRWVIRYVLSALRAKKRRGLVEKDLTRLEPQSSNTNLTTAAETLESFITTPMVNSFGIFSGGDLCEFLKADYDLHILDFETCEKELPESSSGCTTQSAVQAESDLIVHPGKRKNIWALVEESRWKEIISSQDTLPDATSRLRLVAQSKSLSGMVISSRIESDKILNSVLRLLVISGVQCMLLDDAGSPKSTVKIDSLQGVIYKNACIMDNGLRRGFFQASKLRASLSRYDQVIKSDPTFFVGFLDMWEARPLPSVIRRAYKIAKFYNVVFYHGATKSAARQVGISASTMPSSAFDWLKRDDIVQAQKNWSGAQRGSIYQNRNVMGECTFDLAAIKNVIPGIQNAFATVNVPIPKHACGAAEEIYEPPIYVARAPPRKEFWTTSSQGEKLCELGCFDLREELFHEQYNAVVSTQVHLWKLGMLEKLREEVIVNICDSLARSSTGLNGDMRDLFEGINSEKIKIYRGLDSGFCLPDAGGHFWAVSQPVESGGLLIFVSLKSPDLVGAIVHEYLARCGVPRRDRFVTEMSVLQSQRESEILHPRITHELRTANHAELLHMIEQITVSQSSDDILELVLEECERLLIDETSNQAWKKLHSFNFLSQKISIKDLAETRIDSFAKRGSTCSFDLEKLVEAFTSIDSAILSALYNSDDETLGVLSSPVIAAYGQEIPEFSEACDLYSLFFFCSLRKHAFEEVYLETTDRCPLFLQQRDQAAVFAELWVLGSQCEIYFGIMPRALGAIIYKQYREDLRKTPPPPDAWNGTDVFTAYEKAKPEDSRQIVINFETEENENGTPRRKNTSKVTYLAIFCVPAIIDIGLLTFLGRGLYLTAFMDLEERVMANYAVLAALIMAAGVTGWSGSGGGFYLYQSAFHNMNHFMVHRLSGGVVLAILLAIFGFIAFGLEYSWYAGFIFAAYLMVLSPFLNLLGIMSTMHLDSGPLRSGRTSLARCLLITLISPVVTSFVSGHDVLVYLIVLYVFLVALLRSYATLCYEWSSWTEKIHLIKKEEIIEWYEKASDTGSITSDKSPLPPNSKSEEVSAARISSSLTAKFSRRIWSKKATDDSDQFIQTVAKAHPLLVWALEKESHGRPLPPAYTSSWLVQAKLAITEQQQINRGLKEHSPFLLFRNAKYDIAQNVGLFLVALLDRWVAVSMSANGHTVNLFDNARARYGVAFGLLYFLFCAISLDVVLQRYWGETGRQSSAKLGNIFDFEATEVQASRVEKKRWLVAISELVWVMITIFGLMTILLWLFVNDPNQIILYFAYIFGYSGVIIFQFNRVFTTDIRAHVQIVFLAAIGGYIVGIVLHEIPQTQDFRFNDVIALCCASLSAALGTWLFTDFCDDPSQEVHIANEDHVNWKVYSQKLIGINGTSCKLGADKFEKLDGITCRYDDMSILSDKIADVFTNALTFEHAPLQSTFTNAQELLNFAFNAWKNEHLILFLVDQKALANAGATGVFAASIRNGSTLEVYLGVPDKNLIRDVTDEAYENILSLLASEAIIHESCEALLHLRHSDATLAELLLNEDSQVSTRMVVQLSQASRTELASVIAQTNAELERHLALGINTDAEWENTPEDVREAVISRILGRKYSLRNWRSTESFGVQHYDWCIKQCLGIRDVALHRVSILPSFGDIDDCWNFPEHIWNKKEPSRKAIGIGHLYDIIRDLYYALYRFIEFVATITAAGTDCGRELGFVLQNSSLREPFLWIILKFWKVCWWIKNLLVRVLLLEMDSKYKEFHTWIKNGSRNTLTDGMVSVSDPRFQKTGCLIFQNGGCELKIHKCSPTEVPSQPQDYQVASYDANLRLTKLADVTTRQGQIPRTFTFQYSPTNAETRFPISKTAQVAMGELTVHYDGSGRVTHGDCIKGGVRFTFSYDYQLKPNGLPQIMRATYRSPTLEDQVSYQVYWCHRLQNCGEEIQTWSPANRASRLVKTTIDNVEEFTFKYEHKRDPVITQTTFSIANQQITEPKTIGNFLDEFELLEMPKSTSFQDEDLLLCHPKPAIKRSAARQHRLKRNADASPLLTSRFILSLSNLLSKRHVSRYELSTAILRTELWRRWASRKDIDAVTTCLLDEVILRREPTLHKYWSLRDAGSFSRAKECLTEHLEQILTSIEITDDVSEKANLAIKPSDLFVMGLSKDANFVTSKPDTTYINTEERVSVIFTDTGCWPDAPGGVSNCRRDLVDGCRSVRYYALTESANDYGIPRFQVEKNLQAVKNLPLWGLDGKNPSHGLFDNLLQTQVERRVWRTRTSDIVSTFIPLLTAVVRGARTIRLSQQDLHVYTDTFLNVNKFFEENDYLTTWRSKAVRKAWREAWLCEYSDENILNPNDSFQIERPTSKDFDEALELYVSYFFIFSVRVPEEVPRVFQSTHHGLSSLYGMILKLRRGTTWGIWDHAIMWRESCLNVSPAQCILPIAVQSMLLGAMKLAANLAYMHADIILPCTAIYNPDWENEIGTDQGHRGSQKVFARKIDPITNGISNMDSFQPVEVTRTTEPTTIMLSNVQFIKDVKNAIMAAGVIINDFGFKKYQLVVYGAQDRQPSYAIETEELINTLGIQNRVRLGGFGSPKEVLKDAWLFMNSSLSEGLPLAIGEAALSGIPIVATEVGATAQVLTDVDDPSIRYGEVVPPNDPVSLARAQISLLAMLGPWVKYTTDAQPPPPLPTKFTEADVEWITERMYTKSADRRALGMRLREVVQRKFSGERYLREHEQMFWVQRHMSEQRANRRLAYLAHSHPKPGQPISSRFVELEDDESMWLEERWQDFPTSSTLRRGRKAAQRKADPLEAEENMLSGSR